MQPLIVECPACGKSIEIPLAATAGDPEGNSLPVTLTPDLTPITDHATTHQEA